MMMQIVGSFAEFERAMLHERTKNGLEAARKHKKERAPVRCPLVCILQLAVVLAAF
ncbi:recombinase family protein [Xenorhabdus bovienii]|uniref:recombinase family protein n=1 Tax=Xenorhabdus bovienii TaxID=40576 RepID=UPI00387E6D00